MISTRQFPRIIKRILANLGLILLCLGCALAVAAVVYKLFQASVADAYLFGINLVQFLLFLIDKFASRRSLRRVPEIVLHLISAAGGAPAALFGVLALRHKTLKGRFILVLAAIIVVQCLVLSSFSGKPPLSNQSTR